MVPEAGDGRWCQAQRCSSIFSVLSCRSLRDLYFNLYDMNETRITMQKKRWRMPSRPARARRMHACSSGPMRGSRKKRTGTHARIGAFVRVLADEDLPSRSRSLSLLLMEIMITREDIMINCAC